MRPSYPQQPPPGNPPHPNMVKKGSPGPGPSAGPTHGPSMGGKPMLQHGSNQGPQGSEGEGRGPPLHHHLERPIQSANVAPRQAGGPQNQPQQPPQGTATYGPGGHSNAQGMPPRPLAMHRPPQPHNQSRPQSHPQQPPPPQQHHQQHQQPHPQQQQQQQQQQQPPQATQQRLKVEDAISYLDRVKIQFGDNLHVYNQFLDIMKEFKSQGIDTPGVIGRVSSLFEGHPELVKGFNTFLPPGYKIDYAPGQSYGPPSVTLNSQPIGIPDYHPRNRPPISSSNQNQASGSALPQPQPQPPMPHHPQQQQQQQLGGPPPQVPPHADGPPQSAQPRSHGPSDKGTPTTQQPPGSAGHLGNTHPHTQGRPVGSGMVAPQHPQPLPHSELAPPVEFNSAINYVNKIKTRFGQSPDVYKHFLEILHTYQKEQRTIKEVYQQVATLFRYHHDLLSEFSQFLPEAAPLNEQNQNQNVNVNANVNINPNPHLNPHQSVNGIAYRGSEPDRGDRERDRERERERENRDNDPKQIMDKPPTRGTGSGRGGGGRRGKRKEAYNTLPNTDLMQGGPGASTTTTTRKPKAEKGMLSMTGVMTQEPYDRDREPGSRKGNKGGSANSTLLPVAPMRHPRAGNTTPYHGFDDMAFFDSVKKHLKSKSVYENFLRTLNLYTQDLLDRYELVNHVEKFIGRFPALMERFRVIVDVGGVGGGPSGDHDIHSGDDESDDYAVGGHAHGGSGAERIDGHMLDYSVYKRFGHSYRALPKAYQRDVCSGRTGPDAKMYNDVLNDELVLFPVGNDSENFVPSIKNTYEQALSKCEDERYEMDMLIEINMSTLRVLERVVDKIKKMTPDEAMRFRLDGRLGGASTTVHFTALKRLYDTRVKDVIEGLKKNPKDAIPVVLRRLRNKNTEWMQALIANGRQWRNIHEKSVLKSLDARAPSGKFRNKDKDALVPTRIVSEIVSETMHNANVCQADEGVDVGSTSKGNPKRSVFEDKPGFSVARQRMEADEPQYFVCMSDADVLSDVAMLVKHCIDSPRDGVTTTTNSKQGKQEKGGAPNYDSIKKGFTATPASQKKKALDFLQDIVLPHLPPNASTQDKKLAHVLYCDSAWVTVFRLLQILYLRLCEAKRLCQLTSEGKVYSTHTLQPPTARTKTSNNDHTTDKSNSTTHSTTHSPKTANSKDHKDSKDSKENSDTKGATSTDATPRGPTPNGTHSATQSRNGSKPASPGAVMSGQTTTPKTTPTETPAQLYATVLARAKDFVVGSVDHAVFEDFVRSLIGVKAYELYSLDRAVHTLCSQLVSVVQNPLYASMTKALHDCEETLQETIKEETETAKQPYTVYSESVRALLGDSDAHLFRISFSYGEQSMDISVVPSDTHSESITSDDNFASQYANTTDAVAGAEPKVPPVYLARNCSETTKESVSVNKVAARFCLDTNKMVYVRNTFDFAVRPDRVITTPMDRPIPGGAKRRRTSLFPCTGGAESVRSSKKRRKESNADVEVRPVPQKRVDGSQTRVFDDRYKANLVKGPDGDDLLASANRALSLLGKPVESNTETEASANTGAQDDGANAQAPALEEVADNQESTDTAETSHDTAIASDNTQAIGKIQEKASEGDGERLVDSGESDYEMILADDGEDD